MSMRQMCQSVKWINIKAKTTSRTPQQQPCRIIRMQVYHISSVISICPLDVIAARVFKCSNKQLPILLSLSYALIKEYPCRKCPFHIFTHTRYESQQNSIRSITKKLFDYKHLEMKQFKTNILWNLQNFPSLF